MGRKPTPPPPYRQQFYPISDDHLPLRLVAPTPERETRPATIHELVDKSREDLWDPEKSIPDWVEIEEIARTTGKQYAKNGDYERGFIQFTRSASIMEKIQAHKDYDTLFTGIRILLILVILSFFPARPHQTPHLFPLFPTLQWGSPLLPFPVISLRQRILPTLSSDDLLIILFACLYLSSNTA